MIERLHDELFGRFWTRYDELLMDIEATGGYVDFATDEYVDVCNCEDEDERYIIRLGWANRTVWITGIEEG